MIKEKRYFVNGMHCASCEILIEKRLLQISGIKSVEASMAKGEVVIEYESEKPTVTRLNHIFTKDHYSFSQQPFEAEKDSRQDLIKTLTIAFLVIAGFILLEKSGLSALINVNTQSALPWFFVFGLMAGISSCAALVGGMVLSLSKGWQGQRFQPHLLFNAGRLITFALLGAILGGIGSQLQLSLAFTSVLVMSVSLLMLIMGLQMLGLKFFRRFQFTLPKIITRLIANDSKSSTGWLSVAMGAGTFFLPCGFTITAQSLALLSGSPLRGGLMMLLFALGTLPILLLIGLTSVKFLANRALATRFTQIAGVLVLFFAFYNLNSQFNRLGLPSLSDFGYQAKTDRRIEGLPPVVGGKQVIKMTASAQSGYQPSYFKVKAGIPVRWEITDKGTNGCTNAIVAAGLVSGRINLTPGQVSVQEFTPTKVGRYKFSCWMGMVSGIIEVVDESGVSAASSVEASGNEEIISSGASGCGCSGGK